MFHTFDPVNSGTLGYSKRIPTGAAPSRLNSTGSSSSRNVNSSKKNKSGLAKLLMDLDDDAFELTLESSTMGQDIPDVEVEPAIIPIQHLRTGLTKDIVSLQVCSKLIIEANFDLQNFFHFDNNDTFTVGLYGQDTSESRLITKLEELHKSLEHWVFPSTSSSSLIADSAPKINAEVLKEKWDEDASYFTSMIGTTASSSTSATATIGTSYDPNTTALLSYVKAQAVQWQTALMNLCDQLTDLAIDKFYILDKSIYSSDMIAGSGGSGGGVINASGSSSYSALNMKGKNRFSAVFYIDRGEDPSNSSSTSRSGSSDVLHSYVDQCCIIAGASRPLIKRIASLGAKAFVVRDKSKLDISEHMQQMNATSTQGTTQSARTGETIYICGRVHVAIAVHAILNSVFDLGSASGQALFTDLPTLVCQSSFSHGLKTTPVVRPILCTPAIPLLGSGTSASTENNINSNRNSTNGSAPSSLESSNSSKRAMSQQATHKISLTSGLCGGGGVPYSSIVPFVKCLTEYATELNAHRFSILSAAAATAAAADGNGDGDEVGKRRGRIGDRNIYGGGGGGEEDSMFEASNAGVDSAYGYLREESGAKSSSQSQSSWLGAAAGGPSSSSSQLLSFSSSTAGAAGAGSTGFSSVAAGMGTGAGGIGASKDDAALQLRNPMNIVSTRSVVTLDEPLIEKEKEGYGSDSDSDSSSDDNNEQAGEFQDNGLSVRRNRKRSVQDQETDTATKHPHRKSNTTAEAANRAAIGSTASSLQGQQRPPPPHQQEVNESKFVALKAEKWLRACRAQKGDALFPAPYFVHVSVVGPTSEAPISTFSCAYSISRAAAAAVAAAAPQSTGEAEGKCDNVNDIVGSKFRITDFASQGQGQIPTNMKLTASTAYSAIGAMKKENDYFEIDVNARPEVLKELRWHINYKASTNIDTSSAIGTESSSSSSSVIATEDTPTIDIVKSVAARRVVLVEVPLSGEVPIRGQRAREMNSAQGELLHPLNPYVPYVQNKIF